MTSHQVWDATNRETTLSNVTRRMDGMVQKGLLASLGKSAQPRKPAHYMTTAKGREMLKVFEAKIPSKEVAA